MITQIEDMLCSGVECNIQLALQLMKNQNIHFNKDWKDFFDFLELPCKFISVNNYSYFDNFPNEDIILDILIGPSLMIYTTNKNIKLPTFLFKTNYVEYNIYPVTNWMDKTKFIQWLKDYFNK